MDECVNGWRNRCTDCMDERRTVDSTEGWKTDMDRMTKNRTIDGCAGDEWMDGCNFQRAGQWINLKKKKFYINFFFLHFSSTAIDLNQIPDFSRLCRDPVIKHISHSHTETPCIAPHSLNLYSISRRRLNPPPLHLWASPQEPELTLRRLRRNSTRPLPPMFVS